MARRGSKNEGYCDSKGAMGIKNSVNLSSQVSDQN